MVPNSLWMSLCDDLSLHPIQTIRPTQKLYDPTWIQKNKHEDALSLSVQWGIHLLWCWQQLLHDCNLHVVALSVAPVRNSFVWTFDGMLLYTKSHKIMSLLWLLFYSTHILCWYHAVTVKIWQISCRWYCAGIDVSSNQDDDELSEKDIFQIEFDSASKKWKILASNGKYWVMQGAGVQANGEGRLVISLLHNVTFNGMSLFSLTGKLLLIFVYCIFSGF